MRSGMALPLRLPAHRQMNFFPLPRQENAKVAHYVVRIDMPLRRLFHPTHQLTVHNTAIH